uniref:Uncharacterized protein n=1 Tax=Riptortus pedestris TaxID=329032 RepID=R4WMK4_RIPPE|nr:unknown secreted protein [Riptortus pedestris]
MRAPVVLLSLVLLCSLANALGVSRLNDVNPLLEEIIYTTNQDFIKNHQDKIEIKPFVVDGLLYRVTVKGGQLSNLATLALRGDNQVFDQTDGEGYSLFNYDLFVGLQEINVKLDYEYTFLHFIGGSGTVDLSTNTDTVRAKGTLTSYDSGKCEAVLQSAQVTEIGNFNIQFTPDSIGKRFLKFFTSFIANYIVPHVKFVINHYVANIVKNDIPKSDFSKIVCKPLVV